MNMEWNVIGVNLDVKIMKWNGYKWVDPEKKVRKATEFNEIRTEWGWESLKLRLKNEVTFRLF